jgi:two-component system chemotaxis response regulator CheY
MAYNILVVDDSITVRAYIQKTLGMSGVPLGTLYQAANGLEALEVLRRDWVDLVLADINMPVMGGVAMVEEMKNDGALASIPVAVISTEGSATRLADLKEKGVKGFLRKPFKPEELKRLIESLLGNKEG